MTGLALNCEIPERAKFDRKNYPYPDLMKGYQISEYDLPLCINGYLDVEVDGVDAAHPHQPRPPRRRHRAPAAPHRRHRRRLLAVDVNRAGMPLMEIVTEPDARSPAGGRRLPDEAAPDPALPRRQRRQHGGRQLPLRAQPQPAPEGADKFGSKVELKNLNSFRAALRGMEFEVERQTTHPRRRRPRRVRRRAAGARRRSETASQRSKEQAHDYRYFPEPDLPPLAVSARVRGGAARARCRSCRTPAATASSPQYGLTRLRSQPADRVARQGRLLRGALRLHGGAERRDDARSWSRTGCWATSAACSTTPASRSTRRRRLSRSSLATLVALVEAGKISGTAAKEVLRRRCSRAARDPEAIVAERGLGAMQDDRRRHGRRSGRSSPPTPRPSPTTEAGKTRRVKPSSGQVMKETRGRANAAEVQDAAASRAETVDSVMRALHWPREGKPYNSPDYALPPQRQLHQVVLLRHAHQALAAAGADRRRDHGPRLRLHPARGLRQLHLPGLGLLPDPAVLAPLRPRRPVHQRRRRRSSCSASGS